MRATPGGEAHAAAVRLRSIAPLAAFAVPVVLLVVAGVVSAAAGDDAAITWVAIASPVTAVLMAMRDGASPNLLGLLVTALASAPLWSLLGVALARRAGGSFAAFWLRYALCCAAWAVVAVLLV